MFCAFAIATRLAPLRSLSFRPSPSPPLPSVIRLALKTIPTHQRRATSTQAARIHTHEASHVEPAAVEPAADVEVEMEDVPGSPNKAESVESREPLAKESRRRMPVYGPIAIPKRIARKMANLTKLESQETAKMARKAEKAEKAEMVKVLKLAATDAAPKAPRKSRQMVATGTSARARRSARQKRKPAKFELDFGTIPSPTESDQIAAYLHAAYVGESKEKSMGGILVDWKRHHVVSKALCDDIIERMRTSLAKHHGCDILDLNPGPGVFSSAIHDLLKPRTHILMEPESELYKPILQPLLDAEGSTYKFVAGSGIDWEVLNPILTPEYLPHQTELMPGDPRLDEQNNTLLVIANFSYYPLKTFRQFSSITVMLLYQMMSASRAQTLFNKYGIVRMLLWVSDNEKTVGFPRVLSARKKSALMSEVTCEHYEEIASSTNPETHTKFREHSIDIASSLAAMERMKAAGLTTPRHRMGPLELEATEQYADPKEMSGFKITLIHHELKDLEAKFANGEFKIFRNEEEAQKSFSTSQLGRYVPSEYMNPEYVRLMKLRQDKKRAVKAGYNFGFSEGGKILREHDDLEARFSSGEFEKYLIPKDEIPKRSRAGLTAGLPVTYGGVGHHYHTPEFARLWELRKRKRKQEKDGIGKDRLIKEMLGIIEKQKELKALEGGDTATTLQAEITQRLDTWHEQVGNIRDNNQIELYRQLDNYTTFHREQPLLLWDRRKAEPLKVYPEEFYPRHELALHDIQPKALWPILRKNFPNNLDVLEFLQSTMTQAHMRSVKAALKSLAPGAYEYLIQECPSLTDVTKGGNPDLELMKARTLTSEHYEEIVEAWSKWQFRPGRFEILHRIGADPWGWEDNGLREDQDQDQHVDEKSDLFPIAA